EQRDGLLGWLARVVKHIVEGLLGRAAPSKLPVPEIVNPDVSSPNQPPTDNGTKQLLNKLRNDVIALRDNAKKTRSDFTQFQQSGVIGKIKVIARLKSDKDDVLQDVNSVKADVKKLRDNAQEEPLQFLWGLLGIVTGLIHRRFAN
ncbi:MAG: hypothetical protein IID45_13045, partial [Planctomycetes bacterium]|nr:hypothetical protein [Planctomycetota bacterium]